MVPGDLLQCSKRRLHLCRGGITSRWLVRRPLRPRDGSRGGKRGLRRGALDGVSGLGILRPVCARTSRVCQPAGIGHVYRSQQLVHPAPGLRPGTAHRHPGHGAGTDSSGGVPDHHGMELEGRLGIDGYLRPGHWDTSRPAPPRPKTRGSGTGGRPCPRCGAIWRERHSPVKTEFRPRSLIPRTGFYFTSGPEYSGVLAPGHIFCRGIHGAGWSELASGPPLYPAGFTWYSVGADDKHLRPLSGAGRPALGHFSPVGPGPLSIGRSWTVRGRRRLWRLGGRVTVWRSGSGLRRRGLEWEACTCC